MPVLRLLKIQIDFEVLKMANTAVVFKSNYGATRKYAMHIAHALEAELLDMDRVKKFDFAKYDTVIYGGGIYAGKVNGIKFISSNAENLAGKTVIIFTTGLADPTVAKNAKDILKSLNKSLPKELMSKVHIYNFQGGLDYSKLSFLHKRVMSMVKKSIEKKCEDERTDNEKGILESYGKNLDLTDMATASPLIDYVKGLK